MIKPKRRLPIDFDFDETLQKKKIIRVSFVENYEIYRRPKIEVLC